MLNLPELAPVAFLSAALGAAIGFLLATARARRERAGLQQSSEHEAQLLRLESAASQATAAAALQAAKEDVAALSQRLNASEAAREELGAQLLETERRASLADERARYLEAMAAQLRALEQQRDALRDENRQQASRLAELAARSEEERKGLEQRLQLLQEARQQLTADFEQLAHRIFEEKTERFSVNSRTALEGTLNPLRDQLREFKQKVEDVYDRETRDRVSLIREIHDLKQLNQTINQQALNLTKALRGSSKVRGNWGEMVLERVLEDSGLRRDHEYVVQQSFSAEEGGRRQPDVLVRLPENKDIVIDSKVSLADYERYCEAGDDAQRQQAARAHVASLRNHINGLSFKEYERLPGIRTLDFVLLFVPIEAAFMLAVEQDQSLFREAYDRNIIVVSPTTLLATLRTIATIWRYERQNRNAEEIALSAGKLHDQLAMVVESLDEARALFTRSGEALEKVYARLSSGRGSLASRVLTLEKLGAKSRRKLPRSVLERLEGEFSIDEGALPGGAQLEEPEEQEEQT